VDPYYINLVKAPTERMKAGERVEKVKGWLAFLFSFAAAHFSYFQIICSIPPLFRVHVFVYRYIR